MYTYSAFVVSVYDGDTITVDIDLGFDVVLKGLKIRLYGLNTPEIRGSQRKEGIISRDALRVKILERYVTIKTKQDKKGKYGRWLGTVEFNGEDVNKWLIDNGYAKPYMVGK